MDLLVKELTFVHHQFHRLVLLVGPHGSGKTSLLKAISRQQGILYLNVSLQLSQRLLTHVGKHRPLRVRPILADIIGSQPEQTLALDNIELLFEPTLQQEPLALLKELSRNKSLLVAWPGSYNESDQILTHATPGHPEYRRYEQPTVRIVTI